MADKSIDDRIIFHDDLETMEVDFSNITFDSAEEVNTFYDRVHKRIGESGRDKWYFLVNYRNLVLTPWAWIPFANRGKKINIAHSMGSVRFSVDEATQQSIEERSKQENFDANLMDTRTNAMEKIAKMRAEAGNA